jgi:hypothetical protein
VLLRLRGFLAGIGVQDNCKYFLNQSGLGRARGRYEREKGTEGFSCDQL